MPACAARAGRTRFLVGELKEGTAKTMITETKIVVRYAETDQMGIAHHANYAVWFEQARTEFIKSFGISYSEMEKRGVMMPLTKLETIYKIPAHYEDELTVYTRTVRLSPVRIRLEYELRRADTERSLSFGSTEHAFVDSQTFLPVNVKRRMPELYAKMEAGVEEPLRALSK